LGFHVDFSDAVVGDVADKEVASGVELQVQRSAVTQVLPKGSFK
jgi:hypothetical protein